MKIRVSTFASIRDICGLEGREMTFPENCSVGDVIQSLVRSFEELHKMKGSMLFALNEEYCDEDAILHNGDCLAIFPPVNGG